jgi:hypothetical protein
VKPVVAASPDNAVPAPTAEGAAPAADGATKTAETSVKTETPAKAAESAPAPAVTATPASPPAPSTSGAPAGTSDTATHSSPEQLAAFMFFDRHNMGYVRSDDLEALIYALGYFMPYRTATSLVYAQTEAGRVNYKKWLSA